MMKRLKLPVSKKIENVVKRVNAQKEVLKKQMICENLKQFGQCWRIGKCQFCHIVPPDVDNTHELPKSGFIKMKKIHIHDASHMSFS